ncbi:MAG: hypothetical protein LBK76_07215 [Verrucomicrobiales bacterium]|jgi:hypothetical protein|nr:hypothetical protein [Verrucomicrobiales bacterium]
MNMARWFIFPLLALWLAPLSAALEHQAGYPAGATDLVPHNATLLLPRKTTLTTTLTVRQPVQWQTFSMDHPGPRNETAAGFAPFTLVEPDWLVMPLTVRPDSRLNR